MSHVRFVEIELTYGCHVGRSFSFPEKPAPIVLAGPNGGGKSTLLEAVVRTLFGFNRRQEEDRKWLDARRPRRGEPCRAKLLITNARGETWAIDREFEGSEVKMSRLGEGGDVWRGDGNPGANNAEAIEFRRRLAGLIGFADRSQYEITACVHQGQLTKTRLTEGLLRVAAGGHGDVDSAKTRVSDAHRRLTRNPIRAGERRANKPRVLENVQSTIEQCNDEIRQAEEAQRGRGPLLNEQGKIKTRIGKLTAETQKLEAAVRPLAERSALQTAYGQLENCISGLERARRRLSDALGTLETAQSSWNQASVGPLYPDDFPERVAALKPLWKQRSQTEEDIERARTALELAKIPMWVRPVAAGFALLSLLGVAAAVTAWPSLGLTTTAVGVVAFGALLLYRRRVLNERARRQDVLSEQTCRFQGIDTDLRARLKGIPDADTLSPDTVSDRRTCYDQQRDAKTNLVGAQEEMAGAMTEARQALGGAGDGAAGGEPVKNAKPLIKQLDDEVTKARNTLAEKALALKRSRGHGLNLPEGVAVDPDAVDAALQQRRTEAGELQGRLQELEQQLMNTGINMENPVSLRDGIEALEAEGREIDQTVAAYERAYALLCDGYDEFRERDQARLVTRISRQVATLSDRHLGPLEATGALEEATVNADNYPVPLTWPPLSYGEYHCVLLAIRLGATDFLATTDVRPPLIVDDPFVHLDEEHATNLWGLLCAIARDRQVIVATQDQLVLDRLGVTPDIVLDLRGPVRQVNDVETGSSPGRSEEPLPSVETTIPTGRGTERPT